MNLTLTKDTQQDLNDIRELVVKKDYQAFRSDRNRLKLSEVYREVMAFSGFNVDPISGSCSGCINEPVNVVHNYVMHHEQLPDNRDAKVVNVAGGKPEGLNLSGEMKEVTVLRIIDGVPHEVVMDVPADLPDGYSVEGKIKSVRPELMVKHDSDPSVKNMETGEVHKLPEGFNTMEYSELMELAKLYGHTGKRISKESLIEFLTEKVIPKSE